MIAHHDNCSTADADADDHVLDIRNLSRRFGHKLALDDVSLRIPAGGVLGLVGENGAGKTTLIKHVLGLLRAEAGSVRVFGLDPVADPVRVLGRIGYLSEEPDMPAWMRVREYLRYVAAFYPAWDHDYARQLSRDFQLDESVKLKDLSKGQRARVGLLAALAYRPALLVLDEPSSGLDPIVRRDILGAVIRTIADEGRTVLFSSHLLSEVERVSDQVAMIRNGRLLFCAPLDDVRRTHRRVTVRFERALDAPPDLDGALAWEGAGREWVALFSTTTERIEADLESLGGHIVQEGSATLDEIFVARAQETAHAAHATHAR